MDREDQGREFCEKFEKLALESEPDGCKAFKRTLADLIGRKSRNSKGKAPVQSQRDEDSSAFTADHEYQRESPPMQETSEPAWVYPQSSSPPRDPATLPTSGDDTYRFCHETRGIAVLVINSEFDSEPKRKSASDDEHYMYKMFKELNFDVRNLSSKKLLEKMKEIRDAVNAESDCFACVMSSHGMEGQVRTSIPGVREPFIRTEHSTHTRDGVVRTNELLELFNDRNCRPLKGKPKMFFIQACRCRTDCQKSDEIDMGVEVLLVETSASTTSTGSPARFFTRGDMAPTSFSNTGDMAPTSSVKTEDAVPTNSTTTGDVVGDYDDYSGRRRDDFRENFTADVQTTLTRVCGKMALDMETKCPCIPHHDKAKSAACVYHRLSKDIYLQPKEIKREKKR